LANKGQLATGKYQAITPCFRNETHDFFHQKQFMKLELIEYMDTQTPWHLAPNAGVLNTRIEEMVDGAMNTFELIAQKKMVVRAIKTNDAHPSSVPGTNTYDIEGKYQDRWIELGSYGARRAVFGTWIFGTGLAEPRFSKVLHAASF
jgi:phenylalanyl-tRNA synthetase alpha subunit